MIHNQSTYLKSKGIPNIRIWILNDSWYTSERFNTVIRDLKHNFMSGLKSDRRILLFGKKIRVDKYFREHQKAKYFTFKRDNSKTVQIIAEYGPDIQRDLGGFYLVLKITDVPPFIANDKI